MFRTVKNLLGLICLSYMASTFTANMITWCNGASASYLLDFKICVLIMLFSIVFGLFFGFLVAKKKKQLPISLKIIFDISFVYTIFYFAFNSFALITKKSNFWDAYCLLGVMIFAIILPIMVKYVKIKSYLVSSILYFVVYGLFYGYTFIYKANYRKGTELIISITVFLLIFTALDVAYYFATKPKRIKKNKQKEYKSMFN